MRTRRRHGVTEADDTSFWVSFSDVATALMMVFILLVVLQIKDAAPLKGLGMTTEQIAKTAQVQQYLEERKKIIRELEKKFAGRASIDQKTGTFTIDAGLLFDKDKSVLKPNNKTQLARDFKDWISVVLSDKYESRIGQIDIEGHADPDAVAGLDPYRSNLALTQNRARAVAEFVVTDRNCMDTKLRKRFLNVVSVNGRSSTDPILDSTGQVDKAKSRRVVLKFRLKDDQLNEVTGKTK